MSLRPTVWRCLKAGCTCSREVGCTCSWEVGCTCSREAGWSGKPGW